MRRGRLPRDRLDAAGEGLPRLGHATSRPRRRPTRRASASPCGSDKAGGFIGLDALLEQREAGPRRRLRCLVLDEPRAIAFGDEPVRVDGDVLGRVTSGGFGHRVGSSIAFAYLPAEVEIGTRVEVGVFGRWVGAEIVKDPIYDPKMERVRA